MGEGSEKKEINLTLVLEKEVLILLLNSNEDIEKELLTQK